MEPTFFVKLKINLTKYMKKLQFQTRTFVFKVF